MSDAIGEGFLESWNITKPAVIGREGVVASQHYLSSEVGASVLRDGGNAVDAAVAAALHISTVEPWMSGLGGGGTMLIFNAAQNKTVAIDFTMVAPGKLNPADYPPDNPLEAGDGGDLFAWPAVVDNRNVNGPLSFAVPGVLAGLASALEQFGTLSFSDAIAPAVDQAKRGMPVDWYSTLKIASGAPVLARFDESAKTYLPGGHVPCGEWAGALPHIELGNLGATLERLQHAGPADFYHGDIAAQLAADMRSVGGIITADDLANYRTITQDVTPTAYRGQTIYTAPGLTAGPTMQRALASLEKNWSPLSGDSPNDEAYLAYASALAESYEHRLATMGDTDEGRAETCTTHLSVADKHGNVVALTQTLLSIFGSKVMLPGTGLMFNNGIMWFDPRPGRPNSMAAGKRPICNMCPTIIARSDGARFGLGASGGRRIFPAVYQLSSLLTDFDMTLHDAFHTGRIDVSAGAQVSVDRRLPESLVVALRNAGHKAVAETHGVYPALYACPNGVASLPDGSQHGAAFITSPWSRAVAA